MTGLAATLNAPEAIEALAVALAARGADGAVCRVQGRDDSCLEVAVRAVIPAIARVADADENIVAAIAVDGVASITALDGGYTTQGPAGLLGGEDAYAVIVADAERGVLVLARNGAGAGLYYARRGDGWLVASEPGALLAAGVPGEPDVVTIQRFVSSGTCDDTESTFLAGIRRLRPNQVIVLGTDGDSDWTVTDSGVAEPDASVLPGSVLSGSASAESAAAGPIGPASAAPGASARSATNAGPASAAGLATDVITDAVWHGRVGVLLGPGRAGAAVLGSVLSHHDRPQPLPVHTVTFPTLLAPCSLPPAIITPMTPGLIRHTSHTLDLSQLDLDGFLREMGEPVPDLDFYLVWEVARGHGGDVDVLVDSSVGDPACVARVSDRLSARYGIEVRSPRRIVADSDLEARAGQALSPALARWAARDPAGPLTASEVVLAWLESVAAALATPRRWRDASADLRALRQLHRGVPVDASALLRAYLVERWLRVVEWTDAAPPGHQDEPISRPDEVKVDGVAWSRLPLRTSMVAPGDRLVNVTSWLVANELADQSYREALAGPWFIVVSAKVVAISQRRLSPLWEIKPGIAARVLARLARHQLPWLSDAWTMQVALDLGGHVRVAAATIAAGLRRTRWAQWLLPEEAARLSPARPDAIAPADAAVVHGPNDPDATAVALVDALRYAGSPEQVAMLAGCAIVSADEDGSRVLGFAPGAAAGAVPGAVDVVALLCADNPLGQGAQRTPIMLALQLTS